MKKSMAKILALGLASVSMASMVACGGGGKGGDGYSEDVIEISYWSSGYGTSYLSKVIKAFEADNPGLTVSLSSSSAVTTGDIYNRADDSTTDLYISVMDDYLAYTEYLEPLDSVLDMTVDGVKVKDKLDSEYLNAVKASDGKTYTLTWAEGLGGMVYNADVFTARGYKEPKTTTELTKLALTMNSDGYTPFVHYKEYWNYMSWLWMAQLDGASAYQDYWKGTWTNADGSKEENSIKVFKQTDTKLAVFNVLYDLLSPNGYTYTGTNTLSHTVAQTYFLNGYGLMMPNGSWVETEMQSAESTVKNIKMMKTPVISALGTKLGITENQLVAAVAYVDGDTLTSAQQSAVNAMSAETIDAVRKARNMVYSEKMNHLFLIPEYASAKEAAKKFIAYYYSDKALALEETSGMMLPATYSDGAKRKSAYENESTFVKSTIDLGEVCTRIYRCKTGKLLYDGGIKNLWFYDPITSFTYGNDLITVSDYFKKENSYWDGEWNNILTNADLK